MQHTLLMCTHHPVLLRAGKWLIGSTRMYPARASHMSCLASSRILSHSNRRLNTFSVLSQQATLK
jgi:hypothetical protein